MCSIRGCAASGRSDYPDLRFATTLTDPATAGRIPVAATTFSAPLDPGVPPGTYRVRVIGLSAASTPVGSASDALTLTVQ